MSERSQVSFSVPGLGVETLAITWSELSDGYNVTMEMPEVQGTPHPPMAYFKRGEVADMELKLDLMVDSSADIPSAERLVEICKFFMAAGMPDAGERGTILKMNSMAVQIGSWFRRQFLVKKSTVTFMAPYDINTAMPMRATVSMTLWPYFGEKPHQYISSSGFGFDRAPEG